MKVWQALLCFSLLFFLWQRYVMLWLYLRLQLARSTHLDYLFFRV